MDVTRRGFIAGVGMLTAAPLAAQGEQPVGRVARTIARNMTGRMVEITDHSGSVTRFVYDAKDGKLYKANAVR